jgi:hypothetical protein
MILFPDKKAPPTKVQNPHISLPITQPPKLPLEMIRDLKKLREQNLKRKLPRPRIILEGGRETISYNLSYPF